MQNSYDNQEKLARQNSCCASGNLEYAGFWVRMAAYMIDSVVVFAGLLIVRLIFAGISLAGGGADNGNGYPVSLFVERYRTVCSESVVFYCIYLSDRNDTWKESDESRVVSKNPEEKLTLFNVVYRETVGKILM